MLQDKLLETNKTIKIYVSKHLSNASMIIVKCITKRWDVLLYKVVQDCYKKEVVYLVELFY